jgi:hypothetical protein
MNNNDLGEGYYSWKILQMVAEVDYKTHLI